METIGDLVEQARESDGVAFDAPGRTTGYSLREFATSTWKAANLLSHYGVHAGADVAVVVGPKAPGPDDEPGSLADSPDPLFGALGAMLLGAAVDLDPDASVDDAALLVPAAWLDRYDVGPGCTPIAYGGPPDAADVIHFERERWSENPVAPPGRVTAETVALVATGGTHQTLLDRARDAVGAGEIEGGDRVTIDGPVTAETLAPGILAPLAAGGTIVGGDPQDVAVRVDSRGGVSLSD